MTTSQPIQLSALVKPALIGAVIALALISLFLVGIKHPNPAWPKWWMLRPLVIVPLAGATGGACYEVLRQIRVQNGWNKALTLVLSALIYVVGLWMGIVLGLDGTLWN
jgi:integral membrane sensor domain MASE1